MRSGRPGSPFRWRRTRRLGLCAIRRPANSGPVFPLDPGIISPRCRPSRAPRHRSRSPERAKLRCSQDLPLLPKLTVLPSQPTQLLALGARHTVHMATFIVIRRTQIRTTCDEHSNSRASSADVRPPAPTPPSDASTPARKRYVFLSSGHLLPTMTRPLPSSAFQRCRPSVSILPRTTLPPIFLSPASVLRLSM